MSILKSVSAVLAGLLLCVGLTSCSSEFLQGVIGKSYSVTVQIEQYVTAMDATNLVQQAQSLSGPLSITASSLRYIANNVSGSTKDTLLYAATAIDGIVDAVATVDVTKAQTVKDQILDGITKTKNALAMAASYVNLDLTVVKARAGTTLQDISSSSAELEGMLKSAK